MLTSNRYTVMHFFGMSNQSLIFEGLNTFSHSICHVGTEILKTPARISNPSGEQNNG